MLTFWRFPVLQVLVPVFILSFSHPMEGHAILILDAMDDSHGINYQEGRTPARLLFDIKDSHQPVKTSRRELHHISLWQTN
jgi:hypothetical protein